MDIVKIKETCVSLQNSLPRFSYVYVSINGIVDKPIYTLTVSLAHTSKYKGLNLTFAGDNIEDLFKDFYKNWEIIKTRPVPYACLSINMTD